MMMGDEQEFGEISIFPRHMPTQEEVRQAVMNGLEHYLRRYADIFGMDATVEKVGTYLAQIEDGE